MAKMEALGPVREGDVFLMSAFWDMGFRGTDLKRLNRVRKFLCLVHTSDLVVCDGRTITDEIYARAEGESTGHRFPREQLEGSDFCLWKRAIELLSKEGKLLQEIGMYMKFPTVDDNGAHPWT